MDRYKITSFQVAILSWIARKIVIQSYWHKENIVTYYKIIADAAKDEFREDNKPTLQAFLSECHLASMDL